MGMAVRSPFVIDGERIKDEICERINTATPWDEGSPDAAAAGALSEMPDGEVNRLLMEAWDTDDDIWDMFCAVESALIDKLVAAIRAERERGA